jgi:hypothetical protein
MKIPRIIVATLFFASMCFAEPPKTKEEFLTAVRAAYEAKDVKKISTLTWWKGASDEDRKMAETMLPLSIKNAGAVESVVLEPLPDEFKGVQVAYGKRFEPTYPPLGMVKVDYKIDKSGGHQSTSAPYAVIDGAYYIVTSKTTELGWKGPKDKSFTVSVIGSGQNKVKVDVKYNVSGVDLKDTLVPPASSRGFPAQYIGEVTVISEDDDVDVTLRISEEMRQIYESKPLKGKGQIHYKKGD